MADYERAVALWQRKKIQTDAELAEARNSHSIAFAYHSGKMENEQITYNDTREIFEHDGVTAGGISESANRKNMGEAASGMHSALRNVLGGRSVF